MGTFGIVILEEWVESEGRGFKKAHVVIQSLRRPLDCKKFLAGRKESKV